MATKVQEIDKITRHAKRIASGKDTVKPGQPIHMTDAWTVGDCARQGDLYIDVIESPKKCPQGFVAVELTDKDRQLVPGNTEGAKHVLENLAGVTMYRPENWNEESLVGPILILSRPNTIKHPTHGHVHIPAGFAVACNYQVEYDAQLRREARARD